MLRNRHIFLRVALFAMIILMPVFSCGNTARTKALPGAPVAVAQSPSHTFRDASGIMVVYPRDNNPIQAASTFIIGSVPPGAELKANGTPVRLNAQGFFAHIVRLKPGDNMVALVLSGKGTRTLVIRREVPEPHFTAKGPLRFDPHSMQPREDMGLVAGDVLGLSIRATPGAMVRAIIAGRNIILSTQPRGTINKGLEAAFGLTYQRFPANAPDLYFGFYRVTAHDQWRQVSPKFVISRAGRTVTAQSPVKLTVIDQMRRAQTSRNPTVVRYGPSLGRATPLVEGVQLLLDGWQGTHMRCLYAGNRHVYIPREELIDLHAGPYPASTVRTMNIENEPTGVRLAVPLAQRLPYIVEQHLNPSRLVLRIFGATADTDWITEPVNAQMQTLIDHVTWRQDADNVFEATIYLRAHRQWGYWVTYEGSVLQLHIKAPPPVVPDGSRGLSGLTVCLDPGHGGAEPGSIGPSAVRESTVNLELCEKLKHHLEGRGARVVLTRTTDSENPSLLERPQIAIRSGADILLSIHNNALPDGRDPWSEHGTASFYYHVQALELARNLKNAVVRDLGFPDYGARYQNLALARPSNMPSVLVEVAFMINPDEYAKLIDPQYQERIAQALLSGIEEYLFTQRPGG